MLGALLLVVALAPAQEPPPDAPPPDAPPASTDEAPAEEAPVEEAPVENAPVVEDTPVVEEAPVVDAPVDAAPDPCLPLVAAGEREEARRCYAERARAESADAALARELADLVSTLELVPTEELTPPVDRSPPSPVLDFGSLVLSGKAELIATSTLVGGYMAETAVLTGLGLLCGNGGNALCGGPVFALALIAPVVGGGAGLLGSAALVLGVPALTAGDANAVRALMLLGAFNSVMVPIDLAVAGNLGGGSAQVAGTSFAMFATQGAGVAIGAVVAATTDLHEGAGSFAISAGAWTAVLSVLGANAFEVFKGRPQNAAYLVHAAGNVGFAAGMIGAQWLPMSRAETWAVDVGGVVGLLSGAALATSVRAPNPLIGWGTIGIGTAAGLGAGFAAARFVPPMMAGFPELVAVAPLVIEDPLARHAPAGRGDMGASERAVPITGAVIAGRF